MDSVPVFEASYSESVMDQPVPSIDQSVSKTNQPFPKVEKPVTKMDMIVSKVHVVTESSAPLVIDMLAREEHVVPQRVEKRVELQPLTPEQLNSLYYNVQLENNTAYIDRFVQVRPVYRI